MRSAPSTARSLLTMVATFCSGAAGRSSGHRTSTIRSTATRAVAGLSGLSPGRHALTVAPDEPAQDRRRPGDVAAGGPRHDLVGLVRVEVPGVLVDLDPGAQAGHVEFGV